MIIKGNILRSINNDKKIDGKITLTIDNYAYNAEFKNGRFEYNLLLSKTLKSNLRRIKANIVVISFGSNLLILISGYKISSDMSGLYLKTSKLRELHNTHILLSGNFCLSAVKLGVCIIASPMP